MQNLNSFFHFNTKGFPISVFSFETGSLATFIVFQIFILLQPDYHVNQFINKGKQVIQNLNKVNKGEPRETKVKYGEVLRKRCKVNNLYASCRLKTVFSTKFSYFNRDIIIIVQCHEYKDIQLMLGAKVIWGFTKLVLGEGPKYLTLQQQPRFQ